MSQGTSAIPVWVVPEEELLRNGGTIPIQGGPAIPIQNPPADDLISSDTGNAIEEGTDGKLYAPVVGFPVGTKMLFFVFSQTGTQVPEMTVMYNTLGGTPVWTRTAPGVYKLTLAGAFPDVKTFGFCYNKAFLGELEYAGAHGDWCALFCLNDDSDAVDFDNGGVPVMILVFP